MSETTARERESRKMAAAHGYGGEFSSDEDIDRMEQQSEAFASNKFNPAQESAKPRKQKVEEIIQNIRQIPADQEITLSDDYLSPYSTITESSAALSWTQRENSTRELHSNELGTTNNSSRPAMVRVGTPTTASMETVTTTIASISSASDCNLRHKLSRPVVMTTSPCRPHRANRVSSNRKVGENSTAESRTSIMTSPNPWKWTPQLRLH